MDPEISTDGGKIYMINIYTKIYQFKNSKIITSLSLSKNYDRVY
jgi:hypothetical protein